MNIHAMNAAREFISDMAEQISMPAVYLDIRALIENPHSSIEDYAEVIQQDSMLSVRIIRIAQSEFFGFPRKCENLNQAIALIGVIQLHDILLSCLCMRAFSSLPTQIINLKEFWKYSIHCGIASRIIAQQCQAIASNQFFTLGILHEIGHAAMFTRLPEISIEVLEKHRAQTGSIVELEREALGFDYSQLGAEMMRLWQLPEAYQQVAAHHLQPQHADETYRPAVEIVHLAHMICNSPVAGQHRELISSTAAASPQLKSLPENIDVLVVTGIDKDTDAILDMLWPGSAWQAGANNGARANG